MKLRNPLWALHLPLILLVLALPAAAQVFTDNASQSAPLDQKSLSLAEIRLVLLSRNVSPDLIDKILADYPEDRTFTQDEAQILIDSATALAGGGEGGAPPAPAGKQPAPPVRGPEVTAKEPILPPGALPLFGQSIFRGAPEEFQPAQDIAVGPDYILGAGDELSIVLWGSVQKSWSPMIARDGTIALPEVGLVPAAGSSLGEFRKTLRARLAGIYSGFDLSVTLKTLRSIQVSVLGDVRRPGTYTLSPLSSSFNALYYAGGPLESGTLRRVKVFQGDSLVATVDLYGLLLRGESRGDVRLGTDYRVFVPPVYGMVTVQGDVRRPARYEVKPGNTVADLVHFAGGLTATSYGRRAVLDRVNGAGGRMSIDVDLDAPADTLQVRDGDVLTVYTIYHVEPRRYVYVSGQVQSPGRYELYPGMTVSDLVYRAGNTLESVYLARAELSRLSSTSGDSVAFSVFFNLRDALDRPHSQADLTLLPHDHLYVRRRPGWTPQATVDLTGEVRFPGTYTLTRHGEKLDELLKRGGGFTIHAFPSAAGLFRKGQGRVIVDFEKALNHPASLENVALAKGDSIYVPRYNETIRVTGAVSRPGALVYQPGKTADYYLRRTGGLAENADKGRIQIIRVDGVAQNAHRSLWFDPEVPPGAVIEVAAKPEGEKVDWMGAIRDATTIVSGLATTIFIITQIKK
jgi:protein involved in polysaccharide export with SLBB domain